MSTVFGNFGTDSGGLLDNVVEKATGLFDYVEQTVEDFGTEMDYSNPQDVLDALEGKADFEYLGVDGDKVQVSTGGTKYLLDTEEGTYQEQVTGVKGMLGKGSSEGTMEEFLSDAGFSKAYDEL